MLQCLIPLQYELFEMREVIGMGDELVGFPVDVTEAELQATQSAHYG